MSANWTIRHAGAPQTKASITPQAILAGLRDGAYEPTDEVMGPNDSEWVTIEAHPEFEEAMLDIEPEPPHYAHDETKLDMNPLIDVALVLLIFFILTTTYQSLRRVIDMPYAQPPEEGAQQIPQVPAEDIEQMAVIVVATMEDGKPAIRMDGQPVKLDELEEQLGKAMARSGKKDLFVEAVGVTWGVEAKILDAAKGAGVREVLWPAGE